MSLDGDSSRANGTIRTAAGTMQRIAARALKEGDHVQTKTARGFTRTKTVDVLFWNRTRTEIRAVWTDGTPSTTFQGHDVLTVTRRQQ
ncbi:MAG: hypothetical protein KDB37_17460 [Ilumatobacter sp.]|nr:hypothetical protein [Ilumatobacter sp.]